MGVTLTRSEGFYDVRVPVYGDGRTRIAAVTVTHDEQRDVFVVELTGELLDLNTEGVTAAIQLAFRAIAEDRRGVR